MRTLRFKVNDGTDKFFNISFTPPAGTLAARVVATNSSGSSQTLSNAASIDGSVISVSIPASYNVYTNYPSKFEIQLQVDGGAWYTEVEAYGYFVPASLDDAADSKVATLLDNATSLTRARVDAMVAEATESHTPGIELGYASRTTNFTTTNTASSSTAGDIPAMSLSIVGAGRPIELRFHAPLGYHSVANTVVHGVITTNGNANTANNQIGGVVSPSTTAGPALVIIRRTPILLNGVTYNFGIRIWGTAAGTCTLVGAGAFPIEFVATSR